MLGTGGGAGVPPTFSPNLYSPNEHPVTIGDQSIDLKEYSNKVPTKLVETGKPVPLKLLLYNPLGLNQIQHVVLSINSSWDFNSFPVTISQKRSWHE
ncbi:MAG: hypothetical protein ACREAE_00420 [Nitrosopumilaceae archaeon]